MSKRVIAVLALAAALVCLAGRPAVCAAAKKGGLITLRVLYFGQPGSEREKDFVGFLEKHFTKVATADVNGFKEELARDCNVVVLDTGDLGRSARPKITKEFARPIITIGPTGAQICRDLGLKTAYA